MQLSIFYVTLQINRNMLQIKGLMKENMSHIIVKIRKEAIRIEEDCLYSSKSHYNDAHVWSRMHLYIGVPTCTFAVIATATIFCNSSLLTGLFSIFVAILSGLQTFINPATNGSLHKEAAAQYHKLKNEVRLFREIELYTHSNESTLLERIHYFSTIRDRLNASSPPISKKSYLKAKESIEKGEADYQIDEYSYE